MIRIKSNRTLMAIIHDVGSDVFHVDAYSDNPNISALESLGGTYSPEHGNWIFPIAKRDEVAKIISNNNQSRQA